MCWKFYKLHRFNKNRAYYKTSNNLAIKNLGENCNYFVSIDKIAKLAALVCKFLYFDSFHSSIKASLALGLSASSKKCINLTLSNYNFHLDFL